MAASCRACSPNRVAIRPGLTMLARDTPASHVELPVRPLLELADEPDGSPAAEASL